MAGGMSNGGGYGARKQRYRPLAEINVTPMVDVMLVLLIIFMVAAPLMTTAVNVDLPKTTASPVNQDSEPLNVSVDAKGQVFLQDQPIQLGELIEKLTAIAREQKDRRIFVRGDRANSYGTMMEVMGVIIQGGFSKVSLLTEPTGTRAAPVIAPTPAASSPAASPPAASPPAARTPGAPPSATPAAPRPSGRG
ncbi:MAG: protein TolR [Acetobacteraceae bacterium]|nr:protein TolR [Acetobacteraceae bacterium]